VAAREIDQAAAFYGRAVLHAYRFQGIPHAPDEYAQRFYDEITSSAVGRLRALPVADRKDEAIVQATRLDAVLAGGPPVTDSSTISWPHSKGRTWPPPSSSSPDGPADDRDVHAAADPVALS
jgi:hypothetical protein